MTHHHQNSFKEYDLLKETIMICWRNLKWRLFVIIAKWSVLYNTKQLQSCSIVYARADCLYTSCQWPNESLGPDPPLRALQAAPSLPLTIFSLICPLSVPSSQTASHASRCSYYRSDHHQMFFLSSFHRPDLRSPPPPAQKTLFGRTSHLRSWPCLRLL